VKSLSLDTIRRLVMAVNVYTALTMLRPASTKRQRFIFGSQGVSEQQIH
jgi:hypothetical protein